MDDTTCSDRVTPTCASRFWIRGVDFSPLIERVPRKVQTNRLCSSIPPPPPDEIRVVPLRHQFDIFAPPSASRAQIKAGTVFHERPRQY
jgi:hypothetical protein